MKNYYKDQIQRVLDKDPKPYGNRYHMKIQGDTAETKWLSITPTEVKKIKKILNRY